ncbi:sn-glycerol-3-phosphate import ATP-binding protein ugpC [Vibrio nigripulchritudo MADA3029]|uniref:ABC transporter ATP-binding protein n=1 Tax=Vibrio nigripulchritudo TaxID=28173 RepID=UPI0003B20566|nr:ABC transporter ATP-binding protein [Vibrio nigripulchritudo]CCN45976.1 sn-glycerol-3-phosphate import ATP-binding protein ugpC [Vibrio nigripulchritudo MADA3020]CCN54099.1 sn-glycerol-3-phosphate import ATP-binding protein ugpC [Vibrio nigripulchritudo MADA3021]CCN61170.1 sn-glycerol-3-phosphate import ATP-binding protein ugpC [Vibrio nigripulchritudo MADA3029]
MTQVSLNAVNKEWAGVKAVNQFDLNIAQGEFIVLLGPSGCGKTTTMRMIAGLETPTSGEIRFDDTDMTDRLPRDRNIAMVFQNYALYPHMTVRDNIAYPHKIAGVDKSERYQRALYAAEKVGLLDYLDRKPKALSGGQRQRVALARAIVRNPSVFLMDEPLSNLDARLRVDMRAEIKRLQREMEVTMIYVTHDQIEAMTLADRVVIMSSGEIQQIGTPDEVYDDPANLFVAGFLGSPSMNKIHGQILNESFQTNAGELPAQGIGNNTNVVLGVRPEDCSLSNEPAHLTGKVYAVEPTGDATLVVCKVDDQSVTLKADKHFRPELDADIHIQVNPERILYFDNQTGLRLRAQSETSDSGVQE